MLFRKPSPLRQPKKDSIFVFHNQYLSLWNKASAQIEYWESYWKSHKVNVLLLQAKEGSLGEFGKLFAKYVPKGSSVLEAGCGPGHLVAALVQRGYKACGIDNEPKVIEFARANFPDLDISEGDILSIDLPSGSMDCYFSVGVVEHFVDGPKDALREASRVLSPDGVLLISVPHLNPLRKSYLRLLASQGMQPQDGYRFHQYYYGTEDFKSLLSQAGFTILDSQPYAMEAFMIREHPLFARFWSSGLAREKVKKVFRKLFLIAPDFIKRRYAHMMMYVCKPAS